VMSLPVTVTALRAAKAFRTGQQKWAVKVGTVLRQHIEMVRPSFALEDAVQLLRAVFGVECTVQGGKELVSYDDQNFHILPDEQHEAALVAGDAGAGSSMRGAAGRAAHGWVLKISNQDAPTVALQVC
jgi:hypothetical protein